MRRYTLRIHGRTGRCRRVPLSRLSKIRWGTIRCLDLRRASKFSSHPGKPYPLRVVTGSDTLVLRPLWHYVELGGRQATRASRCDYRQLGRTGEVRAGQGCLSSAQAALGVGDLAELSAIRSQHLGGLGRLIRRVDGSLESIVARFATRQSAEESSA